jgi:hypothetical protein
MKRPVVILISLFFAIFNGCLGDPSSKSSNKPIPPRRTFESVEDIDASSKEPFIVNKFIQDDISYSRGSTRFSTALFLSDLGIMEGITKKQFDDYMSLFFSKVPKQDQINEIVIPNLLNSEKEDVEKNAYFFITKQKNQEGKDYYLVESNIPIASINSKTYDGYVINLADFLYKEKIPGSWTSIMFLYITNNNLFYRGMAYPDKSAPLIVSDTMGKIVASRRMDEIVSGKSTIAQVKNRLNEEAELILKNADPGNEEQTRSLTFLKKHTYLSLSAYSYIDNTFKEAREHYLASEKIIIDIPNDSMGSRYNELRKIMNYLINTIGE